MKRKLLLILTSLMLVMSVFSVKAEEDEDEISQDIEVENIDVTEGGPIISGESAILIDAKTGMVLYRKNADEHKEPASITKILTVYLASVNLNDETMITASQEAIFGFDRSSSHIWLTPDEKVRAIDLEYAAFLSSANDASNMLAEGVSESQEAFVEVMNQTVEDLGLSNTHFANAHGLHDDNHYTSAYDMAMITRAVLKNNKFKKIFETRTYEMSATNKQESKRTFAAGNNMIKNGEFYYEYATGGKIGWTPEAGYTIVTTATKDNMDLIAVVLNCSDQDSRYTDTKALFEYGFNNYKTVLLKGSDIPVETVEIKDGGKLWAIANFSIDVDFNILLPYNTNEETVTTSIEIKHEKDPNKIEGYVIIKIDGQKVGEVIMDKEIEIFDTSFLATSLPLINKFLDYFSIFILGLFLFVSFVEFTGKIKVPE
ncbi:MAG: D-alanyl-D-alanine carboxypeptidase [Erysipelotrichaceae bacterium]|nr:D-alanyl-D-alanine carboxypeptidase [Erysipelotrichaceae bacterium]